MSELTFVDAGVLIAAARGHQEIAEAALKILDDPKRRFASSIFVKLETIPKAAFNGNDTERKFYQTYFEAVSNWAAVDEPLLDSALAEACNAGLSAMDSLHVAAARQMNCGELVTTEKGTKPLHRATLVPVRTIQD